MKRALFAIIFALLVTFALAEPSLLQPSSYANESLLQTTTSPFISGRLAFFIGGSNVWQHGTYYLARLELGEVVPLVDHCNTGLPRWSPDGKRFAVGEGSMGCNPGWIVDIDKGQKAQIAWTYSFGGLYKWTSNSRYAIFASEDQYGNSDILVFDSQTWKTVSGPTSIGCFEQHSTGGQCSRGLSAISPSDSDILLDDGTLIQLPDLTQARVISNSEVYDAAWSPDGNQLALVDWHYAANYDIVCTLNLSQKDGSQMFKVTEVQCPYGSIKWAPNGRTLFYTGPHQDYLYDLNKNTIQITPVIDKGTTVQPDQGDDSSKIIVQTLERNDKATFICWSPDKELLAVGTQGALKIYDKSLNLLRSIPVRGTVQNIAWSPVP